MAEGFSTEKGDLPATAASNVTGPAPQAAGLPKWRKKMLITELLAGLVAKFAGLGMVAKAGLGLTLAATSTTAAGAVGALPDPAQHAVATAVAAATPFTFPDSEKEAKDAKDAKQAKDNFGATVSADATDGVPGVDGQVVSDAAKAKAKHDDTSGDAADNGVGPSTAGSTGLDRANETPAAGHAPTSVPARNGAADAPGSPSANGLGTANSTPAAGKAPTSVPPVVPGVAADAGGTRGSGGRVTARP